MDTTVINTLARIELAIQGIASGQRSQGDQLRMLAERQEEIIQLLTPEPKDGPSLDELIGHLIGQMTELTGYARQIANAQTRMEQTLPQDVARAMGASTNAASATSGAGRGSRA